MYRSSAGLDSANVGLRARRSFQRPVGALYGLLVAFVVAFGHRAAGGALPPVATSLLWLTVAAGAGALSSRLHWTFPRLLALFVAVQPLAHLALAEHGAAMADPSGMMTDHAGGAAWPMMGMHAAAAVVTACVVRFGWTWVSTMPALAERVVCLVRQVVAWPMTVAYRVVVVVEGGVMPGVGKVWRSRGPPCGVIWT